MCLSLFVYVELPLPSPFPPSFLPSSLSTLLLAICHVMIEHKVSHHCQPLDLRLSSLKKYEK
jgi:hypothetical protein